MTARRLRSVCSTCGTPYERDAHNHARCPECLTDRTERPAGRRARRYDDRGTRQARGYDAAWDRLSRRARRLQPWCTDCGSPDDLTGDHSPEAWRRRERGLPIRLKDIDVVCRGCNAARGEARGPAGRDRHTIGDTFDALDYAGRLLNTQGERGRRAALGPVRQGEMSD